MTTYTLHLHTDGPPFDRECSAIVVNGTAYDTRDNHDDVLDAISGIVWARHTGDRAVTAIENIIDRAVDDGTDTITIEYQPAIVRVH